MCFMTTGWKEKESCKINQICSVLEFRKMNPRESNNECIELLQRNFMFITVVVCSDTSLVTVLKFASNVTILKRSVNASMFLFFITKTH